MTVHHPCAKATVVLPKAPAAAEFIVGKTKAAITTAFAYPKVDKANIKPDICAGNEISFDSAYVLNSGFKLPKLSDAQKKEKYIDVAVDKKTNAKSWSITTKDDAFAG